MYFFYIFIYTKHTQNLLHKAYYLQEQHMEYN